MTHLEISFLLDVGKFIIYALHRSPDNNIDNYLTELENYIFTRAINKNPYYSIILGHINIDNFNQNEHTSNYVQLFQNYCYINTINCCTRQSITGGTCLDHVLIKTPSLKHIVIYVVYTTITDNCSIILNINNTSNNHNNISKPK